MNQAVLRRPRVAVLLAACNGQEWIEEQIFTILGQRDVELEIIIGLDISTDDTAEYCHRLQSKESRVRVLKNFGPGSASGNFLRLLCHLDYDHYDYVALADQDDIWLSTKLIEGIQCLQASKADAYSSSYTAYWTKRQKLHYVKKSSVQTSYDYLFESPGPGCTFILAPNLVRHLRQHLESINPEKLNLLHFHDWFIYAFARYQGYCWFIDENSYIRYRQHERNVIGANSGLKALIKRVRDVLSGQWLKQVILIADLIGMGKHPFVMSWRGLTPNGLLFLLFNINKIRRRYIDRIGLAFLIIIILLGSCFTKRPV